MPVLRQLVGGLRVSRPGYGPEDDPGTPCGECGRVIFLTVITRDEVWMLCRRALCPFWRRGHPSDPGYTALDRWHQQKRREQAAETNQPVPE